MPRHDHKGKLRRQLCHCISRFWSPFFTYWLLLQVLINSGAHAARMHFPGGKENIQEKKKHQKGGKIIINPSFRFFCNNPAEGVQIMAPDDFCSQLLSHFTKKASICIRSPICQSVYNAITCSLMYSFPLWESIKWYKQQGSKRGVRTVIAHSSLVSLCSVWMLG